MKITVTTADETYTFDATNVCTDEHNNLEVHARGRPVGVFNKDYWEAALYGEEVCDGE